MVVLEGVQPNWIGREFGADSGAIKRHPDFLAAMEARGIEDLKFVNCRRCSEPDSTTEDHPVNGINPAGSDHRKDPLAAGW